MSGLAMSTVIPSFMKSLHKHGLNEEYPTEIMVFNWDRTANTSNEDNSSNCKWFVRETGYLIDCMNI
jgi:hypothetical protein